MVLKKSQKLYSKHYDMVWEGSMERKKSQHFVWRRYLQNWTYNGSLIYCLKNNEIKDRRPLKCACQKYFYRLNEITQSDLNLLQQLYINGMEPVVKEHAIRILNVFTVLIHDRDALLRIASKNKEVSHDLETLYINVEEDYHSKIENNSIRFLDSLSEEKTDFFGDSESNVEFNLYLTTQYFRTKNIQEAYLSRAANIPQFGESLSRSWPVLRFIFAHNMAMGLSNKLNNTSLLLLQNNSDVPFITGDQPVINTKATYHSSTNDLTEELELYYPISPTIAILINLKSNEYTTRKYKVTKKEATSYNNLIADASHQELFAQDKSHLEPYLK
ncbi:MAG TPA: DUF4238 domain-containing protein [Methanofastidiosum sp.]|jgi:hypothetical protein|nr:DUF4238 domain-containing protein [Methanofastidiosum sp.]